MPRKTQTKQPLKNHWADDHIAEASNVLAPGVFDDDDDEVDDEGPRWPLLQLEPALG